MACSARADAGANRIALAGPKERMVASVSVAAEQAPPRGPLAPMALAALGVVYGDIGTSPLYTFKTAIAWAGGEATPAAALGMLSLIVWTLIITTSVKYVAIVIFNELPVYVTAFFPCEKVMSKEMLIQHKNRDAVRVGNYAMGAIPGHPFFMYLLERLQTAKSDALDPDNWIIEST